VGWPKQCGQAAWLGPCWPKPEAGYGADVTTDGGHAVRVFLLDDHEIVRQGIIALLEVQPDIEVVGEASTVAEAMSRIPALRPDVAVLDVRLPDGDGVHVCREMKQQIPDMACLMLTSYLDDEALFEAVMAGAAGYVIKEVRGGDLVRAIRTVAAGGSLLDATATNQLLARLRTAQVEPPADPLRELTEQERRVLELIGQGMTNREIGKELFLAEKTVKNYVSSLLAKLGMQRRTQAAVLATQIHEREQHKH
jgi:two-component system, NarL family, response regulator DevR